MSPWFIPLALVIGGVGLAFAFAYEGGPSPIEEALDWCSANGFDGALVEQCLIDGDQATVICVAGERNVEIRFLRDAEGWTLVSGNP